MAGASAEWVQKTFQVMDQDGNERISMDELYKRSSEAWFVWMDADLNGNLSREEFAAKNGSFVKTGRLEPLLVLMDVNGDGTVTLDEYCVNLEEVSYVRRDNNADGKLDFSEFTAWSGASGKADEMKDAFDRKDLDKDGYVSFREAAIRTEDLDFWGFDQDGDNRLSFQEFRLTGLDGEGADGKAQEVSGGQPIAQTGRPRDSKSWQNFFGSVDSNHDGQVAPDEFRRQPRKWRFIRLDIDGDGFVGPSDFSQVPQIADLARRLETLVSSRDTDKDGKVTLEEFTGQKK